MIFLLSDGCYWNDIFFNKASFTFALSHALLAFYASSLLFCPESNLLLEIARRLRPLPPRHNQIERPLPVAQVLGPPHVDGGDGAVGGVGEGGKVIGESLLMERLEVRVIKDGFNQCTYF